MAAPLPNPSPPPPRGAALRGLAIGVAGLVALGAGLWLALREPEAPAPRVAAVAPPAAVPAAPVVAPAPAPAAPAAPPATVATPAPAPAPAPAPPPAPVVAPVVAAPAPAPAPPPAPAPAPAIAAAPAPAAIPAAPAPAPAPLPIPAPIPAPQAPKFDIVRVSPSGSMVIAGRAEPEATVILRANGREIGRVRADVQGQWAFAGAASLPPGAHEITLAALDPAGREIAGAGTVEAVVAAPAPPPQPAPAAVAQAPSAPAAPAAPIVVLTTPQGAPTLLQAPGRPAGGARLGLEIVDYDAAGDIRFAGTAPAGATIRLYVDDAHVGDAIAGPDGRWSLAPTGAVAQGEHRLRLDQVDPAGRVAARVEQPFQRAAVAALDAGVQRVVVQPRQNLWRIARRAYGQGVRYTEIYAANRDVISDPARIYPGQVFAIPGAASGAAAGGSTPASASRSR
jgi:nucleoid-associated protein YgaU